MKRLVHFEIHASDPERAIRFYTDIFSWEITKWWWGEGDYWMIVTGPKNEPGINGGLLRRETEMEPGSPTGFVCTMDVPSVDEYSKMVQDHGGAIVVPKMSIPGVGWLVYCHDTEGNIFGMMENIAENELSKAGITL